MKSFIVYSKGNIVETLTFPTLHFYDCPVCKVKTDEPCRTTKGKVKVTEHKDRTIFFR